MSARIVRHRLSGPADGPAVAAALRDQPRGVALSGSWAGGSVILSSHPLRVAAPHEDPFALLDWLPFDADGSGEGIVGGGWFGWLGFGLARTLEPIPPPPPRRHHVPRFDLAFHDHVVRRDRDGQWWFEALWSDERAELLESRLAFWAQQLATPPQQPERPGQATLYPVGAGLAGHAGAVAETVRRIAAGDCSQANICMAFEGAFDGDPLALWCAATAQLQPAYSAFIAPNAAGHGVVSLSPELFLRRTAREVITKPIKGTAASDTDPEELVRDAKNRAENVMIVDLMRNDLGRVCRYGSVTVDELCALAPAAGVWHLESTVSGTLRPDVTDAELLRATFPPGSVTGAPKVQALRIIHELEGTGRDAYCGAVGMVSPCAGLELNVAIRTLEVLPGTVRLGAGGGVVSDSSAAAELDEVLHKARGVLDAVGFSLLTPDDVRITSLPPITRRARPESGRGVFETIAVVNGEPLDVVEHLSRIRASCRALGISWLTPLTAEVGEAAEAIGEGAIRLDVTSTGVRVSTRPLPHRGPMQLSPVVLPGGLGAHKWVDRSLIDSYSTIDTTPLICDIDGTVLEAGYAAVLIGGEGELWAPPLDGRLLPSLSRARLLAAAGRSGWRIVTRAFSLGELRDAEAIVLTSTLRGPHPGVIDAPVPSVGSLAVTQALVELWNQGRDD